MTAETAEALEAVHSIFDFIARRAEAVPEGVRWETVDWHNQPYYTPTIFLGSGGIPFFLAGYHQLTGSTRALDLAVAATRWCASPQAARLIDSEWDWASNGIVRGRSGLGLAWLALYAATGDRQFLHEAERVGDAVMAIPSGPITDWQDGAAGEGLFLLRLAEASSGTTTTPADPGAASTAITAGGAGIAGSAGANRFLDGAIARAAWLESVAIREGDTQDGAYWPWQTDHEENAKWFGLSFVPGSSGIAYFLVCLYAATRDTRWATLARAAARTLQRQAVPDGGGLNWPDTLDGLDNGEDLRAQWCNGAAGNGVFLAKACAVLGSDPDLLALALGAGEATYAWGDHRHNPTQCHGLAAGAELFLDLHALTGDRKWHDRATEFCRQMLAYRTATPEGDVWQGDDPGTSSPDFLYGVSGTGCFMLRLWRPDVIYRPLT
jgi:lantibiotic modifying enzyme